MDTSANEYLKGVIESLLFISEKPVTLDQFAEVLVESVGGVVDIRKLLNELKDEYDIKQRGMVIVEIAGGYQMLSSQHYASYVRNFLKTKVKEKLSRPALETLAIVAYKQPVSRGDIEIIRGVNSDGVVLHLLNKGHIKIVGKKDVPGRPFIYGTTKLFLEYFGLKSLLDLPKLEDVSLLLAKSQESAVSGEPENVAPIQEESATSVSQALDEAEAKAAQDQPDGEMGADVEVPALPPPTLEEHLEIARRNVQDLLPESPTADIPNPMTLKEAMDEMGRDDNETIVEESSRIKEILKEETRALEIPQDKGVEGEKTKDQLSDDTMIG